MDTVSAQRPTLWSTIVKVNSWQVALDPDTKDRTGFETAEGNFIFNRIPMGCAGAVSFFQMVMQKVLKGLTPSVAILHRMM
jgi:hypothetical protein